MQVFKKQCQKDFAHRGKTVIFRLRNAQSQPLRERKLLLRIDYWFFIVIFVELCYNPLSQKRENRMNNRNGEVLQILRENIGLSQLEVAKRLHVRRQTISNWELCKTMVNVDDLKVLSSIYDFDFTQLLHCYTAVKNLPSREEIIRMQEDYRKSLMNKEKANDNDASQSDEQPADKPAETVETTDSLDEIALAKDDTAENAPESEAKEKHKRKLHPLVKTALLSAGISTAVCVLIVLSLWICMPLIASSNNNHGDSSIVVNYSSDTIRIIALSIIVIILTTAISTALHLFLLRKKLKRRK